MTQIRDFFASVAGEFVSGELGYRRKRVEKMLDRRKLVRLGVF